MIYKMYLCIRNNIDLIPVFGIPILTALIITYIGYIVYAHVKLSLV